LFLISGAYSQDFRATLTGRVTDATGGGIPGVNVDVRNVGTNQTASAVTDEAGNYRVPLLRPGSYEVSAEQPGFKKYVRSGVELAINQIATVDIQLEVGELYQQITVTGGAEILELSNADRGGIVDNQQVRELPLNARNPFMLGMLVAGVNFNGASIWQRPFDNGAIAEWTINGSQSRGNEFLLDGAPNNGQAGGNNIAYVPPVDAVEEFKIMTNTYDAQYGKTTGGIVNVSLRSGTNDFHGTLYEFMRREWLDANDFRNKARNAPRSKHWLDQYGGQVQGPVILPKLYNGKDKTFFMFNYEGYREGVPAPLTLSVPEPEMRTGDFSKLVDSQGKPITIYDPATGRNEGGKWVRDPFTGNKIPANRIHTIASKILSYHPAPNNKDAGAGYSRNNLFIPGNIAGDSFFNWVLKIDHNLTEKHRFFVRYAENDRTEDRNDNGVMEGPGQGGQQPFKRVNHAVTIDHVGAMSPTFVINVRASFNRFEEFGYGRGNVGFDKRTLGFPDSLVDQMPHEPLFGRYEFTDYSYLGRFQGRNLTNTWALHPNLNKIRGSHTFKGGVDLRWTQYITQDQGNPFRLQANRGWTQKTYSQGDANSGDSIASFLLGLPGGGGVDYNLYPTTLGRYLAPWFQDDWKVTPTFTLNLGIRWDINIAPNERFNRLNRGFDDVSANPINTMIDRAKFPDLPTLKGGIKFAGVDGNPRIASDIDWNNIQPRVGFAWQLSKKLVMRGGFGQYYVNPTNDYMQFNGFSVSTGLVTSLDGGMTPREPILMNNLFPTGIQVPAGASAGLLTFLGRGFNFVGDDFVVPYVNQFSLGFQYEIPWESKIEVSYVGNRTNKLQTERAFNEPNLEMRKKCNPLEGGDPVWCDGRLPNPFYNLEPFRGTTHFSATTLSRWDLARPYPHFGSITERTRNDGKIWYNSLQVTWEKRAKNSFNAIATYTLSKQIERWGFNDVQQNIMQQGLYTWDRPHRFTLGGVYQLPFGPNRKLLGDLRGLPGRLLEGWEVNTIFQWQSGRPWNQNSNVIYLNDAKLDKIDWSQHKVWAVRTSTKDGYTAACVAQMDDKGVITMMSYSTNAGCTTYDFLRKPRYSPNFYTYRDPRIRLHAIPSIDFSVNKSTRLAERVTLQLRFEAFNLTNSYEYGGRHFVNDPNNANFGSTFPRDAGNTETRYPRQIQLAAKIVW
jgi:hypothetical protein